MLLNVGLFAGWPAGWLVGWLAVRAAVPFLIWPKAAAHTRTLVSCWPDIVSLRVACATYPIGNEKL